MNRPAPSLPAALRLAVATLLLGSTAHLLAEDACIRPQRLNLMNLASHGKCGYPEFEPVDPARPRFYLKWDELHGLTDNLNVNSEAWDPSPGDPVNYTNGTITQNRTKGGTWEVHKQTDEHTCVETVTCSGTLNYDDDSTDTRTATHGGIVEDNPSSDPNAITRAEHYHGTSSLILVDGQLTWNIDPGGTANGYYWVHSSNSSDPEWLVGQHIISDSASAGAPLGLPGGVWTTEPTEKTYNLSIQDSQQNYVQSDSITLSQEFTTHRMIEIAKEMAELPPAVVADRENYGPRGNAYTLKNTEHTAVNVRKLWFYFKFPTEAGVPYTLSWTEVTVGLEGGVSEVQRMWQFTGNGSVMESPIFWIDPPFYDAVVFVVNELVCKDGATGGNEVCRLPMRPSAAGPGCCGSVSPNGPSLQGGVNLNVSLGASDYGESAGTLHLSSGVPDEETVSAASLQVVNPAADTEVIRDANGNVAQVRSWQYLAHVRTASASTLAVHVFPFAQISTQKVNGLYPTNGATETVAWIVDAPQAAQGIYNQITVTEYHPPLASPTVKTTQFDYAPATSSWTMLAPDGAAKQRESVTYNPDAHTVTQAVEMLDPAGEVVFRDASVYSMTQAANGGVALFKLVATHKGEVGSPGERIETFIYNDSDYVQRQESWSGSWSKFSRESFESPIVSDRPTETVESYLDYTYADFQNDPALCRKRVYDYATVDAANDDGTMWPQTARKETEYILGQVVRQTQRVVHKTGDPALVDWVKEYQVPSEDADITDSGVLANTLVTKTTYHTTGTFAGQVKSVLTPDLILTTYGYADAGTNRTTTVRRGQPNGTFDAVTAGTQTVTVVSVAGLTLSSTTTVIETTPALTLSSTVYSNFDPQGRAQTVTYLDGTTETYAYGCCSLDSTTARDGTVTSYGYDGLKRRTSETTAGVTTITDYDWAGNVKRTRRQGGGQPAITLSQSHYNTAGELDYTKNQLEVMTTYVDAVVGGVRTRTTTEAVGLPEVATHIETYYRDGQLKETSGTGTAPMRYEHGIETDNSGGDGDRQFQKVIRLTATGGTDEWTKSYTDFLGRPYKTLLQYAYSPPASLADYPFDLTEFNSLGQVRRRVDADGVATLFRYNAKGELEVTAVDVDNNQTVDETGKDRLTKTTTTYFLAGAAPDNVQTVPLRRTAVSVLGTDNSDTWTEVQRADATLNGLVTWNSVRKGGSTWVISSNVTAYGIPGARTVTGYAPDNTRTFQSYANGRLTTVTGQNSSGGQVTQTTYLYDAYGRQWKVTDARNGTTLYGYKANTDLLETVTTPVPGNGQSAQVTTTVYDNLQRPKTLTQSDGTVVERRYYPTGLLQKTWGSRTYPVEYAYDAQGRMKTMTTWQTYPTSGSAVTTWNYHGRRGWLDNKRYADPATGTVSSVGTDYKYTKGGRLYQQLWAREFTPGQRIYVQYKYGFSDTPTDNQHGDVTELAYGDGGVLPTVFYQYDRRGRRTKAIENGTMTTTYTYNDANLPLSETYSGGVLNGLAVSWNYDSYLRRDGVSANTATVISQSYGYDTAGRLQTVSDGSYSATYAYHANSRLISTVTSKQTTTTRLTVSRSYDKLNRLQNIQNTPGDATQLPDLSAYGYNDANQRVRRTLADGSYWVYSYDALGQVTSGKRYWNDGTPVAGQQFEYAFDDIGNRTGANGAKTGGDQNGANLRSAAYTPNLLNQYASRSVPGYLDIMGLATASSGIDVSVNGSTAGVYERGEYFRKELTVANNLPTPNGSPQWQSVTVSQNGGSATTGNVLVPPANQIFSHDLDGNLTGDGLWDYTWDAENRLVKMESPTGNPAASRRRLEFKYDAQGRRIWKKVTKLSDSSVLSETRFLYDGWNLLGELSGASGTTTVRTYLWGTDLSGSLQGAGGVGGLLAVRPTSSGISHFAGYDGNGNLTLLVDGATGLASAAYEYGPFGEPLRVTGPLAAANPFAFSTKFTDRESGLLYYGYRYYSPSLGRWLNRDPMGQRGGINTMAFLHNSSPNGVDTDGRFGYFFEGYDAVLELFGPDWTFFGTVGEHYMLGFGSQQVLVGKYWEDYFKAQPTFKKAIAEMMGKAASYKFDKFVSTGQRKGGYLILEERYINDNTQLLGIINQAWVATYGTWEIISCDRIVLSPTGHRIVDDLTWKSQKYVSPGPEYKLHSGADDWMFYISAVGERFGGIFGQQFPFQVQISGTEPIEFIRGGRTPKTKAWPFD